MELARIAKIQRGEVPSVPIQDITRKLDADFFHGRWSKATDRQRELLQVVSVLPKCGSGIYGAGSRYAVPLLGQFIQRQGSNELLLKTLD